MIYVIGTLGFIGGFILGQFILAYLLRNRTKDELLEQEGLRLYGFLNWVVAVLASASCVWLYGKYIGF